ncbi:MAG: glycosyltransferase family A protein [Candidatus Nitrotoga sp.]
MSEALCLERSTALPLALDNGTIPALVYRYPEQGAIFVDELYLFHEARRVLRPGGIFRILVSNSVAQYHADPLHLANLVGLRPLPVVSQNGAEAFASLSLPVPKVGETALDFCKPDRQVSGSPLISLLIPAYSPRFFKKSLESAIAQTYENIEIIICDDSSGPEIEEISGRLGRIRPLRYERNPIRLKGRGNYKKCFELATGEFIKYLNDDDILVQDCVERLLDAFRLAPDIVMATSYRERIDEAGNRLPDQPATRPIVDQDMSINGLSLVNAMLKAGLNVVGEPSTTLFRKDDLLDGKPDYFCFDGVVGTGVIDMSMWSTLLLKGDAVYLRDGLSQFRIHPGQHQLAPEIRQVTVQGIRNLQGVWLRL